MRHHSLDSPTVTLAHLYHPCVITLLTHPQSLSRTFMTGASSLRESAAPACDLARTHARIRKGSFSCTLLFNRLVPRLLLLALACFTLLSISEAYRWWTTRWRKKALAAATRRPFTSTLATGETTRAPRRSGVSRRCRRKRGVGGNRGGGGGGFEAIFDAA